MTWSKTIPFKVSVSGIIEIMGKSLYSRPETAVRELLQNAHDAVTRRRQQQLDYKGAIRIWQDSDQGLLRIEDDGIGLTANDCEEYLSTLGVGLTGLIRRGAAPAGRRGDRPFLIGQFGIGLFSAFLLADRLIVESRHVDAGDGVRWEAGPDSDVQLTGIEREGHGSTVTLVIRPDCRTVIDDEDWLEEVIRQYADYLPVPIYLNDRSQRVNVIHVPWLEATPDRESLELALEEHFGETPLDVIPLRVEKPASMAGALYVTPRRVPGFSGESVVTATVRRMVISRRIQGLLPEWAPFLRGMLELNDCAPTASREDLVRDAAFQMVAAELEEQLYSHFERLAEQDPSRWESVLAWHRYSWTGAALTERRLRNLLRKTYLFPTSKGTLTFDDIIQRSEADALFETEADRVLWYNSDRRQERWMDTLFGGQSAPCVHVFRTFDESLLAMFAADVSEERDEHIEMRIATPSAAGFASQVLGVSNLEESTADWQAFLEPLSVKVFCASFSADVPVMAFLNERHELRKTFDELKDSGNIPAGFQRLIDRQFRDDEPERNEVILNTTHKLVSRALEQKTTFPLASVLRLLVLNALTTAGATVGRQGQEVQADDLDWIAETLWKRGE